MLYISHGFYFVFSCGRLFILNYLENNRELPLEKGRRGNLEGQVWKKKKFSCTDIDTHFQLKMKILGKYYLFCISQKLFSPLISILLSREQQDVIATSIEILFGREAYRIWINPANKSPRCM
jgi:hypothetical protein